MKLPYDLLKSTYVAPKVFLCETDKTKICELNTIGLHGTFKFNSYSEISFDVPRTLIDTVTGESYIHPYYDKIEALRLLYLPGFGYFEIQDPSINSDGIKEIKSINAFSLEYSLSQKYLVNFIINNQDLEGNLGGGDPSVISKLYDDYAAGKYTYEEYNKLLTDITTGDPLVQFYNKQDPSHSLLHLVLQKAYGWTIGHVDQSLVTQTRSFNVDRESIYDFLMNEVAQTFKCYFVFDTVHNIINVYSETNSIKFNGDGSTTTFILSPIFTDLGDVTINGYRTLDYSYDTETGIIQFMEPPEVGSIIEVNDGAQTEWQTNVFVSFDNIASEMEYSYEADNIKTCLKVTGADDLDINDVNLGFGYVMDLSYFNTPEWMGQELYEAYNKYLKLVNEKTPIYTNLLQEYNKLWNEYSELYNRVTTDTKGDFPTIYLNELKLDYFKKMLQKYYCDKNIDGEFTDTTINIVEQITDDFKFLGDSIITDYLAFLQNKSNPTEGIKFIGDGVTTSFTVSPILDNPGCVTIDGENISEYSYNAQTGVIQFIEAPKSGSTIIVNNEIQEIENRTYEILNLIWHEFGISILNIYVDSYINIQQTHLESGWGTQANGFAHKDEDGLCDNYCLYWANYLMLNSCQTALNERSIEAADKQKAMDDVSAQMAAISEELSLTNNFTDKQLVGLNSFIREDEYSDQNFVITEKDTIDDIFKTKKELLQCGKIELSKLCAPIFSFTAQLANIYALKEFEPIIDQFQLGNLINISLRPGYFKRARLMEVDINFEDFSDFSCIFGDLIAIKSQADIHADLLKQAASAGKSVASNSSYWDKGADMATKTDIRIQNGLLDANTRLKAIDGNQGIEIDKNGIWLKKVDKDTGEIDAKQGRLVNNMFCFTDDNWKTTRSVFGEYNIDGTTYWGLLAEACIAGYIEGSTIVGSEIKAGARGDGTFNFSVSPDGHIIAQSGTIAGWEVDNKSFRYGELGSINSMWVHRIGSDEKASIGGSGSIDGWTIGVGQSFGVTKDGKLYSTAGEIAGWNIEDHVLQKELTKGNMNYQISMQSPDGNSASEAFTVKSKRTYASTWNTQFSVDYQGKLIANDADITGKITTDDITAKGGTIGGWSINSFKIYAGDSTSGYCMMQKPSSSSTIVFSAGGISSTDTSPPFKVTAAGRLTATNANITGTINATAGTIGGCSIIGGQLKVAGANITSISANQITTGTLDCSNIKVTHLSANSITTGTLVADRIAGLDASKIISGTFATARIPSLNASKITAGTLSSNLILGSGIKLCSNNGAVMESYNGGVRIYSGNKNPYFAVYSNGVYMSAMSSSHWNTIYVVNSGSYGAYLYSGTGYIGGTWYISGYQSTSSDENKKNTINPISDTYEKFFDNIGCYTFKFNDGTSDRLHCGFVSQRIKDSLDKAGISTQDFGGVVTKQNEDGTEDWYIRYDEFVPLNTWQIQKLKTKVSTLEEEVELLKQQIESLKQ